MLKKQEKRHRRHKKVRAKIFGTEKVPRLSVFKSNQYIYAQLINDEKGRTIVSAKGELTIEQAKKTGESIAKKAREKKIEKVVFDRGGYGYHGRVKALAEGAREGGLKF
jgi:large subunit ribosomal protein L18